MKMTRFFSLILVAGSLITTPEQGWSADLLSTSTDPTLQKAYQLLQAGDADKAEALYRAALKDKKAAPWQAAYGVAVSAQKNGKIEHAQAVLTDALRRWPKQAELYAAMADLLLEASSPSGTGPNLMEAEKFLNQAQALAPQNASVLTGVGRLNRLKPPTPETRMAARSAVQSALLQDPAFLPAHLERIRLDLAQHDTPSAKDHLFIAMELAPHDPEVLLLRAQLLAQAQYPAEAVRYAQASDRVDAGPSFTRDQLLATQFEKLGEAEEAAKYYERLLKSQPNNADLRLRLGDLYQHLGKAEQSHAAYQEALQLDPTILAGPVEEARTLTRQGKTTEALSVWRSLLVIQPGQPEALHGIASIHYACMLAHQVDPIALKKDRATFGELAPEDSLTAVDHIKMALAESGQMSPDLQSGLEDIAKENDDLAAGEALFLLGHYQEAQQRLDLVDGDTAQDFLWQADRLRMDREFLASETLYRRGLALENFADLQVGLSTINRQKSIASGLLAEGDMLFNEKKFKDALTPYQQAVDLFPQNETVHLRLAETYEKLKHKADAYRHYKAAVELQPTLLNSKGFAKRYRKLGKKSS